jgi:hypothetical protein
LVIIEGFKDSSEMLKNYKELKVWQNPIPNQKVLTEISRKSMV